MLLLAIETSCDETSVAVLRGGCVLANAVSSQVKLHEEYGGVVPELASREHLRNLMPVAREALGQADVATDELDAIAATRGPGLPGALLVGLRAAQGLAFALAKPSAMPPVPSGELSSTTNTSSDGSIASNRSAIGRKLSASLYVGRMMSVFDMLV